MLLKKIGLAVGGVALAAFGFVAAAQAAATNVNVFNGSGTQLASDVSAFDWSETGSGVALGVGPFGTPLAVGQQFDFKYQSFLVGFTSPNAVAPTLVTTQNGGAFSGNQYQLTVAASFREVVTGFSAVGPLQAATFDVANQNGTFSIFYDDATKGGTKANVATGTGFDDGVEIARFTVVSAVSGFFANPAAGNSSGTAVVKGNLKIAVDFVNPDYLQALQGTLFDFEFESNQQFPPTTSNTNAFFVGGSATYPTYNVDKTCTGPNTCDIVFKVDGQNSFTSIPEPQTLLMFGMGLLMLGSLARRGKKRTH